MKIAITISRILVGSLFIVSGLIKSNDALGFMYKLEEYFEVGALNMEYLIPWALPIAVFICVGEILLGVAMLIGALPKPTAVLTLAMMLFFTWLTFYTDSCDPFATKTITNAAGVSEEINVQCVLECGCFGNAIPLTPHESFIKDLIILIFVIPIMFGAFTNRIRLNTSREDLLIFTFALVVVALFSLGMLDWTFPVIFTAICLVVSTAIKRRWKWSGKELVIAGAVTVCCLLFQYFTLNHLPMKDYRPYAHGENIRQNMKDAEALKYDLQEYFNNNDLAGATAFLKNINLPYADSLFYVSRSYEEYQQLSPVEKEDSGWEILDLLSLKIGLHAPKTGTLFPHFNKITGADTLIKSEDYLKLWKDPWYQRTYTMISSDSIEYQTYEISDGMEPTILDFQPQTYAADLMLDQILDDEGYVFLQISKDLGKSHSDAQEDLNKLATAAQEAGQQFIAITSAGYDEAEDYRHEHSCAFPFIINDQTELKIVVRSNPGLVLLKDGTVIRKWSWRDIPTYEEVSQKFMN